MILLYRPDLLPLMQSDLLVQYLFYKNLNESEENTGLCLPIDVPFLI